MSRTISSASPPGIAGSTPRLRGAAALFLAPMIVAAGCGGEPGELRVDELRAGERLFVERFVILERARAVALVDPAAGAAILDSLASVWGDTAANLAVNALPADPQRAARLYELVARLLAAEADSLVHAPHPRRLRQPLPKLEPGDS